VTKSLAKGTAGLLRSPSFAPGECPHFTVVYSQVFRRGTADSKGDNQHSTDYRTRAGKMKVSPRQEVGWEKSHVNGRCLTAERSLGTGVDRTQAMLDRLFGGTGRPGDGHLVQNSRKRRTAPSPHSTLMQEAADHMARGVCAALTKKGTLCQRKSKPGTFFCLVHTVASTTAGA
jgi:hypothetical protein